MNILQQKVIVDRYTSKAVEAPRRHMKERRARAIRNAHARAYDQKGKSKQITHTKGHCHPVVKIMY